LSLLNSPLWTNQRKIVGRWLLAPESAWGRAHRRRVSLNPVDCPVSHHWRNPAAPALTDSLRIAKTDAHPAEETDPSNDLKQEALGILGVNLIYARSYSGDMGTCGILRLG